MTKPTTSRDDDGRMDRAQFPIVSDRQAATPPQRGVLHGHVVAAVGLLHRRMAEPWTLGSLAEQVHVSRSQLVRSFDATVGMSPMAQGRGALP